MPSVLVTGVGGFIGSAIAHRFRTEGYEVFGVDDFSSGHKSNVPSDIEFIEQDLVVSADLPATDLILHLAGQSSGEISFDDPISDLEKNTISCLRLIEHAKKTDCSRFLYASSMSIYGAVCDEAVKETCPANPLSCYGVAKLAAENYLKVYAGAMPSAAMRMFNVYGPGQNMSNLRQGMVSIYLAQALKSNHIEIKGSLERFRDFIFIDDVVDSWFAVATAKEITHSEINVGTGFKTTVADLAELIKSLLPGTSVKTVDGTPGDQNGIFADTTALSNYLRVASFTSLDTGLRKFLMYLHELEPRG